MATRLNQLACGAVALLLTFSAAQAQLSSPAPDSKDPGTVQAAAPEAPAKSATTTAAKPEVGSDNSSLLVVQASTAPVAASPAAQSTTATSSTTTAVADPVTESGGAGVREFQGDDVGQVLRLLARQAKINMVVSESIQGTVTMRLEDVTALQAIDIIAKSKGLFVDKIDGVYYIKTGAERDKEPTVSESYTFSYAQLALPESEKELTTTLGTTGETQDLKSAISVKQKPNEDLLKLIKSQLQSGVEPQFDLRTNTVFYREVRSNLDNFRKTLADLDRPTRQVMIEARLVEVNANPRQAIGINWAGVVGSSDSPQKLSYGTSSGGFTLPSSNHDLIGHFTKLGGGSFAILSAPQLSVTLQALNEDSDTEFLANPRVVTSDNTPAKIEIVRAQPIADVQPGGVDASGHAIPPTFNAFKEKTFGNTLLVKPTVNKENFITLAVKPIISNKVADQVFTFQKTSVTSPVIDTRSLESNVLIKSGDTLAIGGLLSDEVRKARTKVPGLGDVPVLGYLFQSRENERVKRSLLVFVTPTVLDQRYRTGLEDQVTGLRHTGEEYADPNGWRNNAKGAVRLVPTAQRSIAADYPVPGVPPPPSEGAGRARFMTSAKDRDF